MMKKLLIVAVILVVLYLLLSRTSQGQKLAGQFPFPVPPLFGVNRGQGYPGG
jgi:hypothetical protein